MFIQVTCFSYKRVGPYTIRVSANVSLFLGGPEEVLTFLAFVSMKVDFFEKVHRVILFRVFLKFWSVFLFDLFGSHDCGGLDLF